MCFLQNTFFEVVRHARQPVQPVAAKRFSDERSQAPAAKISLRRSIGGLKKSLHLVMQLSFL
jgi:hypothetical protein